MVRLRSHARCPSSYAPSLARVTKSAAQSPPSLLASSSVLLHCSNRTNMLTLFNDGIITIYSYQTVREWYHTAATSKRNFTIAHSQKKLIRITRSVVQPTIIPSVKKSFFSCFSFCNNTTEDDDQYNIQADTSISPWSLRHHITTAEFASLPFHTVPQYLRYPALESLKLTIRIVVDTEMRISRYSSLHLPRSLTRLDLSVNENRKGMHTNYHAGL